MIQDGKKGKKRVQKKRYDFIMDQPDVQSFHHGVVVWINIIMEWLIV